MKDFTKWILHLKYQSTVLTCRNKNFHYSVLHFYLYSFSIWIKKIFAVTVRIQHWKHEVCLQIQYWNAQGVMFWAPPQKTLKWRNSEFKCFGRKVVALILNRLLLLCVYEKTEAELYTKVDLAERCIFLATFHLLFGDQ